MIDPLIEKNLADETATVAAGEVLGRCYRSAGGGGLVVFLEGDLGAGKTTFCRGVLRAFDHLGAVKSPTYTLVEPYALSGGQIYHFDLYRLGDPEELEYIGIRDYLADKALCLIEWPERGLGVLPLPDIRVRISVDGDGRRLKVLGITPAGERIVASYKADLTRYA